MIRKQKKICFIHLNDGSCIENIQLVVSPSITQWDEINESGVNVGTSIWCTGKLCKSMGKEQNVEVQIDEVDILGKITLDYPLTKFSEAPSKEFLRENAHIRCRTNIFSSMIRIRNALAFATHEFWQKLGFYYIHTPILTSNDCEGAGEMFQVTTLLKKEGNVNIDYTKDFFNKPAYLSVSGQLNGEMYACGMSNIYTFGPTFRAENSHTSRHAAEFWMIEPEIAFCDLSDNMDYAEAYVKYCIKYILDNCGKDLEFCDKQNENGLIERLKNVVDRSFTRMTYTDAIEILLKDSTKQWEVKPQWGDDLRTEHERYLSEVIVNGPVFVTNYPKEFKSFYMRLNEDGKTVAACDLLVPKIGELIGGSQREERYDELMRRIEEMKLDPSDYKAYMELRKWGSVPHSGFGLGFERLVMFCTGMENIRDVLPFPRWPGHIEF